MNPKHKLSKRGKRIRFFCIAVVFLVLVGYFIFHKRGDNGNYSSGNNPAPTTAAVATIQPYAVPTSRALVQPTPRADIKPDESGKIMVIMFHNFVTSFAPTASNNGEYVMTFDDLNKLLKTLYDRNFRPISMSDYLANKIDLPQGYTPVVFTFDDGTSGQFNLIKENGKLVVNPDSAVGVMEKFNSEHPDFNLQGTFYINMGASVFKGEGTPDDRLKYLIDKGFEIGNHTYSHIDMYTVTTQAKVEEEIGKNQSEFNKIIPGYKMNTMALPLGHFTKNKSLDPFVIKGNYNGTAYENKALFNVGAEPALPVCNVGFDPANVPRVRSSGVKNVDADLNWWLSQKVSYYISDGNPDVITVPADKESKINKDALNGRRLETY